MARRGGRITIRPQPKRHPPRGMLSAQRTDEGQLSAATRDRAAAGRLPLIRPQSEPRAPSPKGEGSACRKTPALPYRECRGDHWSPASLAQQRAFRDGFLTRHTGTGEQCSPLQEFFDSLHLPPKGEGFLILIYRPNTDPKLLNQFEMFCTWVCRLLTVSIRAGSSVRTLFRASTSTFFSCAVISGRSCIMLSSWA